MTGRSFSSLRFTFSGEEEELAVVTLGNSKSTLAERGGRKVEAKTEDILG